MRRCLAWLLVLVAQLAGGAVFGQGWVADEVLVKFRPGTPAPVRDALHRAVGGVVRGVVPVVEWDVVSLPSGVEPQQAAALYARSPNVAEAEPNFISVATATPNDPSFGQEWGLTRIQAPLAWDVTQGREDITIAILDSGIDQDHEDLVGKVVANQNFTTSDTVDDLYGHGTHIAGIVAAATNNSLGIAGVGYRCSLMNVKVLGDDYGGAASWIAGGIVWAADAGARVICMSFGSPGNSQAVRDAVDYAWNRGAVLVASAGSRNSTNPNYPAFYDPCIAVAATDPGDRKEALSNFGPWVDVAAPGLNILSTVPNHPSRLSQQNYGVMSGTSQATAFVAGLAGLIWSTPYGTSNAGVRDRIEATCDAIPGTGTLWAHGRINAGRAVGAIQ
jgi:thermitase